MWKSWTYKKYCKSKGVGTSKDSEETQSTKSKSTQDEKGDVYLASTSTKSERESWLIDSGASLHMTPHRHWFYEYEELKGGDVLLDDDSPKKIIGRGKVLTDIERWEKRNTPICVAYS